MLIGGVDELVYLYVCDVCFDEVVGFVIGVKDFVWCFVGCWWGVVRCVW